MPHSRLRYLDSRIKKNLRHSPIVGILGQRQVGKTTLLESCSAEYLSLDRERFLLLAESDPEVFLMNRKHPFGIDEAQLCAKLYPALKEHVRTHKRPGQFLLTGSVRFTSRKVIRESLTGRIVSLELLPFTVSEASKEPLPDDLFHLIKLKSESEIIRFFEKKKRSPTIFKQYLESGGLPGICFFRDPEVKADKFEAQLDTLLNRDIRLIYQTTLLYPSLRRLLAYLAKNQGNPFQITEASREAQISKITIPKVLFAFEALFLIRPVPISGTSKTTYFIEDQGMATWLKEKVLADTGDITRGIFSNLRQEISYRPEKKGKIYQWRTRNGAEVPLVFETTNGVVGILSSLDKIPSAKLVASASSFMRKFPSSKTIIAYQGEDIQLRTPNHIWMPYWLLV